MPLATGSLRYFMIELQFFMTAEELYKQCFAQVWPSLQSSYDEKEVDLVYVADTGSDQQVVTEENLLTQVLTHLLQSALVQTLRGTEVRITVGAANKQCVVSIRDHGPGVSSEVAEKLYNLQALFNLGLKVQVNSRQFIDFPTDHGTRITAIF